MKPKETVSKTNGEPGKALSRAALKEKFRNGNVPVETDYANLIDSMVNKQDDGFDKSEENGLVIKSGQSRLLSFFESLDELNPFFTISKDTKNRKASKSNPKEKELPGLRMSPGTLANQSKSMKEGGKDDDQEAEMDLKSFFFDQSGQLGIGGRPGPGQKLLIDGTAAMTGRSGTFRTGKVEANGKWHPIVKNLNHCQAFEVMARVGIKDSGKYALLHAIALSTYGKSHSRIRKTCAYFGLYWNKLDLRWSGKTNEFCLELRTKRNYGTGIFIHFEVTQLWNDHPYQS